MPPPIEHELLLHATALRALARDLVGEHDADDVVQEAALQALRRPPERAGALGGWLVRIVQRLSGRALRSRRRRAHHEGRLDPPEHEPPADRALEHRETLRRVTAAVLALPMHYQRALLLRYFEDLTPTQIAACSGESLSTVKTRLQRGLGLLRERLDGDGEGGEWRALLVSAFGLEQAAAVAAGVLVMGMGVKLAFGGVAAVVAVTATLWLWRGDPGASAALPRADAAHVAAVAADVGTDQAQPQAPQLDRREVVTTPSPSPTANLVTVRGRCVDAANGAPLAGASASLELYPPGNGKEREPVPARITGDDGRFELKYTPDTGSVHVELRADRRLHRDANLGGIAAGRLVDLGDIAMSAGARVHGRTLDDRGRPIAHCNLSIRNLPVDVRGGSAGQKCMTRSDDDGSFAFDDYIPAGTWDLAAGRAGWIKVEPGCVTVGADTADVEVTVRLAAPPSIAGTVVDDNGRPVAGADVRPAMEQSNRYPSTESKADGSFELFALEVAPPPDHIQVAAEGFELSPPTDLIPWGSRDLRFVLRRGVSLDIEVVEQGTGRPVEEYAVAAPKERGPYPGPRWPMAMSDHGRRTLAGLQRGRHVVAIMPKDEMLLVTSIKVDVVEGAPTARIEVEKLAPLQVRVEAGDGTPLADAMVEVLHLAEAAELDNRPHDYRRSWPAIAEQLSIRKDPFGARYSHATTDAGGVATVGVLADDSKLGVRAHRQGWSPRLLRQPALVPGQPLVLTLMAAASLQGKLRVAGYPEGRVSLVLDAMDDSPTTNVPLAADGTFAAENLLPGQLAVHFALNFGGNVWPLDPPLAQVELRGGETSTLDLDATKFDAGDIKGRIVVDGQGLAGAKVEVAIQLVNRRTRGGDSFGPFFTDELGRFRATGLLPGECALRLLLDDHGHNLRLTHEDKITLTAGATLEREFHFLRRRLLVHVHDDQGASLPDRRIYATWPEGSFRNAKTDAYGIAEFDWMPAGKAVLSPKQDPLRSMRGQPPEGTEVEVPAASAETKVELLLQ